MMIIVKDSILDRGPQLGKEEQMCTETEQFKTRHCCSLLHSGTREAKTTNVVAFDEITKHGEERREEVRRRKDWLIHQVDACESKHQHHALNIST